jgi:hypothetical protein
VGAEAHGWQAGAAPQEVRSRHQASGCAQLEGGKEDVHGAWLGLCL